MLGWLIALPVILTVAVVHFLVVTVPSIIGAIIGIIFGVKGRKNRKKFLSDQKERSALKEEVRREMLKEELRAEIEAEESIKKSVKKKK